MYGQEQSAIYLLAVDQKGTPVLDLKMSDIAIKEDVGPSTIVSVRRFGWPLKVTVLVDNGPRTSDALVHYRTGLKKFFAGLPPGVPVSLIATAPNPRWLFRETKDKVQIEKGVNLITIDEGLGRFSDALVEYAERLDEEFQKVETTQLPPYLPVLVSIATTDQDGSEVRRDSNVKMITSLRKHRVWTTMIMVAPGRALAAPGGLPAIESNEGQNAANREGGAGGHAWALCADHRVGHERAELDAPARTGPGDCAALHQADDAVPDCVRAPRGRQRPDEELLPGPVESPGCEDRALDRWGDAVARSASSSLCAWPRRSFRRVSSARPPHRRTSSSATSPPPQA